MNITGKIKIKSETYSVGSGNFQKRDVVIQTAEQYPQTLLVEFTQDSTSLVDNYQPGDSVDISINIRGREWTNPQGEVKYFTSLQGWRIKSLDTAPAATPPPSPAETAPATQAQAFDEDLEDDLPFF